MSQATQTGKHLLASIQYLRRALVAPYSPQSSASISDCKRERYTKRIALATEK